MTLAPRRERRRSLVAGAIGNFVEWFDYSIYGFMAVTISAVLFDPSDPTAALLATFGVFALPVITRPLGGIVFARFGDRLGRKRVLAIVLILMSLSTASIGLIPSYDTIGVAAPVLLVVVRIVQGFSAGGEYAGGAALIAESAPREHRGFLVSMMPASTGAGLLTGSLFSFVMTSSLSEDQLLAWGWRVGFLLALPMGVIGLYIRLKLEETEPFRALVAEERVAASPLRETVTTHLGNVFRVAGIALGQTVCYYVVLVYTPTYVGTQLDFSTTSALAATSTAIAAYVITIPVAGRISDRVGRKPLLFAGAVAMLVLAVPTFGLLPHGSLPLVVFLQVAMGGVALGTYTGPLVCAWVELFPTRIRYSGVSLGFSIATVASVSSPFVLTWMSDTVDVPLAPAWYVAVAAGISLATLFVVPETAPAKGARDLIALDAGRADVSASS